MIENVTRLDLSDPDVREMAERHHYPEELWSNTGQLHAVRCATCFQDWPCATRLALRRYRDEVSA